MKNKIMNQNLLVNDAKHYLQKLIITNNDNNLHNLDVINASLFCKVV